MTHARSTSSQAGHSYHSKGLNLNEEKKHLAINSKDTLGTSKQVMEWHGAGGGGLISNGFYFQNTQLMHITKT